MKMYTPSDVSKLFRTEKSKMSLLRDEENGAIPKAERIARANNKFARMWKPSDLPEIGKKYGFLVQPSKSLVISIYTAKGGVLKTSLCFNFARILALNGIKTLVVGLDVQCSITDLLLPNSTEVNSLEEVTNFPPPGLYEASRNSPYEDNKFPIDKVIQKTDLPTLDFIPESVTLNLLEQKIRDENMRELYLSRLIAPLKEKYQVIIFDNSPNWNFLIRNSLVAADIVISPFGCDIGSYKSVIKSLSLINDFKKSADLNWDQFIVVPTLLDKKVKVSLQIEREYRYGYKDLVTSTSLRRAAIGQESSLKNISVLEADPKSELSNDYYELSIEMWNRIIGN